MNNVTIKDIKGNILHDIDRSANRFSHSKTIRKTIEQLVKEGKSLAYADLSKFDLVKANLQGINLQKAKLCGTNFRGADLFKADLSGADLYAADFRGANLHRANLSNSNMQGNDIIFTSLDNANLKHTVLDGVIIENNITLLPNGYFIITNADEKQSTLEIFNTNQGLYFRLYRVLYNEEKFIYFILNKHDDAMQWTKFLLQCIEVAKIRFSLN